MRRFRLGHSFLVSPHTDTNLVRALADTGVPWIPGAFTPTEILAAWRAGAVMVKTPPGGMVGPGYLKDVLGPLRHIPLLPTGGVTLDNAASFLTPVPGAWAWARRWSSAELVASGQFDELERRARRLTQTVAAARASARGGSSATARV